MLLYLNTRVDLEKEREGRMEERKERGKGWRNKGRNRFQKHFIFKSVHFTLVPACHRQDQSLPTIICEKPIVETPSVIICFTIHFDTVRDLALLSPMKKDRLSYQRLLDYQAGQGSRPFKSMACSLFTMLSCLTETKSKVVKVSLAKAVQPLWCIRCHPHCSCSLNLADFL